MVLSDAKANDGGSESDSSDTADMPSECVTSEPVETASGCYMGPEELKRKCGPRLWSLQ